MRREVVLHGGAGGSVDKGLVSMLFGGCFGG